MNLIQRIDRGILQRLHDAPRPADLDPVDPAPIAEAKVHYSTRLGEVTARWIYLLDHQRVPDPEPNDGADSVTVAARSSQLERHIVLAGEPVAEIVGAVVEVVGHDVELTIAIEIGDYCATRASRGPLAPMFFSW